MDRKYPPLKRKEAEKFKKHLLFLLYDTSHEYPDLSLRELCDEVEICYRCVIEWSELYPDWLELLEDLDRETEIPRLSFFNENGMNIPT